MRHLRSLHLRNWKSACATNRVIYLLTSKNTDQSTTGRLNPKTGFAASQSSKILQEMVLRAGTALVDFVELACE